jgi:SAM-dependent methyltransferase
MAHELPRPQHRWFAALYDRIDRSSDRRMRALRQRLLDGVRGRVLEIGCGTGNSFDHYDWAAIDSLDATEPDPYMLQRAREKAGLLDDCGMRNVFVVADLFDRVDDVVGKLLRRVVG